MRQQQIKRATELGAEAFRNGKPAASALCVGCGRLLADREVGAAPTGEASNLEILASWAAGWHSAAATASSAELAELLRS